MSTFSSERIRIKTVRIFNVYGKVNIVFPGVEMIFYTDYLFLYIMVKMFKLVFGHTAKGPSIKDVSSKEEGGGTPKRRREEMEGRDPA